MNTRMALLPALALLGLAANYNTHARLAWGKVQEPWAVYGAMLCDLDKHTRGLPRTTTHDVGRSFRAYADLVLGKAPASLNGLRNDPNNSYSLKKKYAYFLGGWGFHENCDQAFARRGWGNSWYIRIAFDAHAIGEYPNRLIPTDLLFEPGWKTIRLISWFTLNDLSWNGQARIATGIINYMWGWKGLWMQRTLSNWLRWSWIPWLFIHWDTRGAYDQYVAECSRFGI